MWYIKLRDNMKKYKKEMILSAVILAALIFLEYLYPYSGDDWAWGGELGLFRLKNHFADYNGRYAGNLLVLVLTRSRLIRVVIKCITYVLIIGASVVIVEKKSFFMIMISTLTFFLIPKDILVQTYAWTSGFCNYMPPVALALIYMSMIKHIFHREAMELPIWKCICIFWISLVGTLFMENITLYFLFLGAYIIGYDWIYNKKVRLANILFMAGASIGTIIMFSNGAYHIIMANEDEYRCVAGQSQSLIDTIYSHLDVIERNVILLNPMFFTLFTAVIVITGLFALYRKEQPKKLIMAILANILSYFMIMMRSNFSYWRVFLAIKLDARLETNFISFFILMFYVSMVWITDGAIEDTSRRHRLYLEEISILAISAPLLIVSPIGPRCLYAPYLFMTLIGMEYLAQILDEIRENEFIKKWIQNIAVVGIMVFLFYYISIYYPIHECEVERVEYVSEQIAEEKKQVNVYHLPYKSFVHCPDAEEEIWRERFLNYYHLPDDIEMTFIDKTY